jgi:hypothetical protein
MRNPALEERREKLQKTSYASHTLPSPSCQRM